MKFEASQVENIGRGGMCFSSRMAYDIGTCLAFELRTPYSMDTIYLEGHIISSTETIKGMIHVNHLQFENITPDAADVLDKIEKYNSNKV
jgi:hypothetical protein